jgi:1-deoxyxylulose-5-phosphate synthase
LGCVTFGREIDAGMAMQMMDHALARGVTHFDTASAYGGGASESIIGDWLAAHGARSRVLVATKVLPPYKPDAVAAAVAASLSRLRCESIDLLYLHRWDASVADDSALAALHDLVRRGLVRTLGASNFSSAQLEQALARQTTLGLATFSVVQNIHNLAVRGFDPPLTALGRQYGLKFVGYSPLGAGFLTGKHTTGVAAGSRFELIPGHQAVYFHDSAQRRLARLQAVAARSGISPVMLALAWALRQPGIDTVLVGGRSPGQIDQAIRARDFTELSLLRELDAD